MLVKHILYTREMQRIEVEALELVIHAPRIFRHVIGNRAARQLQRVQELVRECRVVLVWIGLILMQFVPAAMDPIEAFFQRRRRTVLKAV